MMHGLKGMISGIFVPLGGARTQLLTGKVTIHPNKAELEWLFSLEETSCVTCFWGSTVALAQA
jgi:hypothetical protein